MLKPLIDKAETTKEQLGNISRAMQNQGARIKVKGSKRLKHLYTNEEWL